MGLSIVQRIIAGFVLMLLLLVLLGFISILKIRGINEGLSQVSDRATPLVIAVAGLKGALQDSNRWVLTYRTSEDATQLPQLASQFKAQQARSPIAPTGETEKVPCHETRDLLYPQPDLNRCYRRERAMS